MNIGRLFVGLCASAIACVSFDVSARVVCAQAYVMGQSQQVCWTEEDPNSGGTPGGGTGGGESGGGTGGGLGSGTITWTGVWPEIAPGVAVNPAANTVRTTNLTCGDEMVLRQREAQYALVRSPLMRAGTVVAVQYMSTQQIERFVRSNMSGSLQFVSVSGCG